MLHNLQLFKNVKSKNEKQHYRKLCNVTPAKMPKTVVAQGFLGCYKDF